MTQSSGAWHLLARLKCRVTSGDAGVYGDQLDSALGNISGHDPFVGQAPGFRQQSRFLVVLTIRVPSALIADGSVRPVSSPVTGSNGLISSRWAGSKNT